MSEDRTQSPTKRRMQEARSRGMVPRSGELPSAAGLAAAVLLLWIWGDDLAAGLVDLIRSAMADGAGDPTGDAAGEAVARLRDAAWAVAGPALGIVGGGWLAAVAAHQGQVGGLWVPGLVAPDPSRLGLSFEEGGRGPGLATRGGRLIWAVAKMAVVAAAAWHAIATRVGPLGRLGASETPEIARVAGGAIIELVGTLAAATLVLGAVDFWLHYRQFEAATRMTPDEFREDQKAADGDPALCARRRQAVRARDVVPDDAFTLAAVALTGDGATLLLGGGPPPARVLIHATARGPSAARLLRQAEAAGLPVVDAPAAARRLARRGRLDPADAATLAALWPSSARAGKAAHRARPG